MTRRRDLPSARDRVQRLPRAGPAPRNAAAPMLHMSSRPSWCPLTPGRGGAWPQAGRKAGLEIAAFRDRESGLCLARSLLQQGRGCWAQRTPRDQLTADCVRRWLRARARWPIRRRGASRATGSCRQRVQRLKHVAGAAAGAAAAAARCPLLHAACASGKRRPLGSALMPCPWPALACRALASPQRNQRGGRCHFSIVGSLRLAPWRWAWCVLRLSLLFAPVASCCPR